MRLEVVPDGGPASCWEALRAWDAWLAARGLSDHTRRAYRGALIGMATDTLTDPLVMTERSFVEYLNEIDPRGPKASQVVKACRSFYPWALRRGLVAENPAEEIQVKKHRQGKAPTLEEADLRRVLSAAFRKDPRRGWILLLACSTGARESSVAALTVADVDLGRRYIEFRTAKGGRPYGVPLGRRGFTAARWLRADAIREGRETLAGVKGRTLWRWAQEAGAEAGVRCYFHLMRHQYGTKLAEDPAVDERTWIELMNHSDGSQFTRYAAARPGRLRDAQERF